MKKIRGLLIAVAVLALLTYFTLTPLTLSSQQKPADPNTALPEKVMKIVKTSCMACHDDNGNEMAMSNINFSKWDSYLAKKQAKKALAMCREIKNGNMPPAGFLAKNPGAVLTPDKIAIICNWANSIQPAE